MSIWCCQSYCKISNKLIVSTDLALQSTDWQYVWIYILEGINDDLENTGNEYSTFSILGACNPITHNVGLHTRASFGSVQRTSIEIDPVLDTALQAYQIINTTHIYFIIEIYI